MRVVVGLVALVLLLLLLPPTAGASAKAPVPNLVQTADRNGDGWALCWQRGAAMAFYCPVFPRGAVVAVRAGWWIVAMCAAGIVAFIAGNTAFILKLRKAGGAWKAAKQIIKAGDAEARAKVIAGIFGEVTGVGALVEACGG